MPLALAAVVDYYLGAIYLLCALFYLVFGLTEGQEMLACRVTALEAVVPSSAR